MHPRRSVSFSYCFALLVALFLVGGFFIGAAPVHAQEGIVACTGVANSYDQNAVPCGTCEFIATFNNVIDFMIVLASIVSTIAIVIIGLRLVTSGGSEVVKTQAKQAMGYIATGLFLLIGAYAIVGAIITALVPDTGENSDIRNWRDFNTCIYATPPSAPRLTNEGTGGGPGGSSSVGSDGVGVGVDLPGVAEEALCNSEYLSTHFPGEERIAQCVLKGESSCGAVFYSVSDKNAAGVPFSVSAWQINLTVWDIEAGDNCSTGPVKCTDAFTGGNYTARLTNESVYRKCIDALRDPACAGSVAERIRKSPLGWKNWSAYNNNCS